MNLPNISSQQQIIVDAVQNNNIVVDAVAGSGKTTTNLYIGLTYPNKRILVLTYNAKLKLDTREKVIKNNLKNIDVHSYHSFCGSYYRNPCKEDSIIQEIFENKLSSIKRINFDIIVVDEAQDMKLLYYELVCKIYNDNINKNCKLIIMGDKNQSIYQFMGADDRFIRNANTIFDFNKIDFKFCKLSVSYRITNEMSNFVNKCLLKKDRMNSVKSGNKVRYIISDSWGNDILKEFEYYLSKGYKYEDIYIIAPSIKSANAPVIALANKLSKKGIPIWCSKSDTENPSKELTKGKVCFMTYHVSKGLENKVIIAYGFDEKYFTFFAKDLDPNICPNTQYVVSTRGIENLSVIHHKNNNFLPFIDIDNIYKYCDFPYMKKPLVYDKYEDDSESFKYVSVTDTIKFLSHDVMRKALSFIKIKQIKEKGKSINIPLTIKNKKLKEDISFINGIAIPTYFEYLKTGNISIQKYINIILKKSNLKIDCYEDKDIGVNLKEVIKKFAEYNDKYDYLQDKNFNIKKLLHISNLWNVIMSRYSYTLYQITKYDWFQKEKLIKAADRLNNIIKSDTYKFEYGMNYPKNSNNIPNELYGKGIRGAFDIIDNDNLWEIKCVKELTTEHFMQVICYMYLYKSSVKNTIHYFEDKIKNEEKTIIHNIKIESIKNIKIDDYVKTNTVSGMVKKIFKNGNINLLVDNKSLKIKKTNIIKNITEYNYLLTNSNKIIDKYKKELNFWKNNRKFKLYNVLNDELFELSADYGNLVKAIDVIFYWRYKDNKKISEKDFIDKCEKVYNHYNDEYKTFNYRKIESSDESSDESRQFVKNKSFILETIDDYEKSPNLCMIP